ncbi:MAG: hypothetical protein EOP45_00205 [Sphingobacteriaceae bacterium]|nr:MAG: hypothetical protein EOP45_00205 [Sphingobacteriaceae bacterium]
MIHTSKRHINAINYSTSTLQPKAVKRGAATKGIVAPRGFFYIMMPDYPAYFEMLLDHEQHNLILTRYIVRRIDNRLHMAVSFSNKNSVNLDLYKIFRDVGVQEEELKIIKLTTYKQALSTCQAIDYWHNAETLFQRQPMTKEEIAQKECREALIEVDYNMTELWNNNKYKDLILNNAVYINSLVDIYHRA